MNSSSDTPIDSNAERASDGLTGDDGVAGDPGDAGSGIDGFNTTGVRIAGVRITGEVGAVTTVAGMGFAGLGGAGVMATGIFVSGAVVPEEVCAAGGATVDGVDRTIDPLRVLVTSVLTTLESAGVSDESAPQAAIMSNIIAAPPQRTEAIFDAHVTKIAIDKFRIWKPLRVLGKKRMLEQDGTVIVLSEI